MAARQCSAHLRASVLRCTKLGAAIGLDLILAWTRRHRCAKRSFQGGSTWTPSLPWWEFVFCSCSSSCELAPSEIRGSWHHRSDHSEGGQRLAGTVQRNQTARRAGQPATSALSRALARGGNSSFRTVYLTRELTHESREERLIYGACYEHKRSGIPPRVPRCVAHYPGRSTLGREGTRRGHSANRGAL